MVHFERLRFEMAVSILLVAVVVIMPEIAAFYEFLEMPAFNAVFVVYIYLTALFILGQPVFLFFRTKVKSNLYKGIGWQYAISVITSLILLTAIFRLFGLEGSSCDFMNDVAEDFSLVNGCISPAPLGMAAYFTVVTMTTLGYGDVTPIGQGRLFAALGALLGYAYLGLGIAWIASASLESSGRK